MNLTFSKTDLEICLLRESAGGFSSRKNGLGVSAGVLRKILIKTC